MTEKHSSATISFEAQSVESVTEIKDRYEMLPFLTSQSSDSPFSVFCLEQTEVSLPFVADDLAASEAPNRNDHLGR